MGINPVGSAPGIEIGLSEENKSDLSKMQKTLVRVVGPPTSEWVASTTSDSSKPASLQAATVAVNAPCSESPL